MVEDNHVIPVIAHLTIIVVAAVMLFAIPQSYIVEATAVAEALDNIAEVLGRVRVFAERTNFPYSVSATLAFLWFSVPILAWIDCKYTPEREIVGWCKEVSDSMGRTAFLVALFLIFPVLYACSYGKPLLWERVLGFSSLGVFLFNGIVVGVMIPVLAGRVALILKMRIQAMIGAGK